MLRSQHPIVLWFGVLLTLFFAGCTSTQSPLPRNSSDNTNTGEKTHSPGLPGLYSYSGYSADSTKLIYGTLEIRVMDSLITGTRNLQLVDSLPGNVYEVGNGAIEGEILPSGDIRINLTPGMLATLEITGTFDSDSGGLEGNRVFNSGATPVPQVIGYFVAEKMR